MNMIKKCVILYIIIISANGAKDCAMNVGTVLFAPSDANKDCWSADSLALLTSRMILEGILPDKNYINVNDGDIINDVIEYFRLILEVVRKNTVGKTKHIMLLALTDALGGYMKHFFLPVAKYAYYAGNIDYNSVIKVHQLFDELKNYLRTNGAGWSKPPKDIGQNVAAEPISLKPASSKTDPCKGLVFSTATTGNRARKRRNDNAIMDIPMPYFDSKSHPSAIAVPFKAYSLRNMESKSAAYVLLKYYIAATKCLSSKTGNEKSLQEFNTNLFAFITKKVVPHFPDEKFYSAFGGVLRIMETMKTAGYVKNGKIIGSFNIMPESEEKNPEQEQLLEQQEQEDKNIPPLPHGVGHISKGGKPSGTAQQKESKRKKNKSNLILLAALATIIIWFILGACFICCRIRSARIKRDEQLKLLEGIDDKKSVSSESTTKTKCMSTPSSKSRCSSKRMKGEPCTQLTCPNYASSSATIVEGENEEEEESQKSEASVHTKEEDYEGTPKSGSSISSRSSKSSKSTSGKQLSGTSTPKSSPAGSSARVQPVQYYPATFACHSSITGKYKAGSSSDELSSKDTIKKPFVFGYDFQTTSEESSPGETSDGETEMGGNMSK